MASTESSRSFVSGFLQKSFFLQELKHFHHLVVGVFTAVEQGKVFEYLFLQSHEHSGNQFLISNGVGFQSVGHYVVDVLDEDNVCIEVVPGSQSISAPWPPGRNSSLPLSRKGWLSMSAAIVSVLGFCSEKVM